MPKCSNWTPKTTWAAWGASPCPPKVHHVVWAPWQGLSCLFLAFSRSIFTENANSPYHILAPMPHLAMLGVGCPLWVGASANALNFQGHPPPGAKKSLDRHANCPKKAKNHQNASCDKKQPTPRPKWQRSVSISNQLQKPGKNQPGTLVGMPWQDFGRQGQCSKPGGLPGGCHLDLCIFLGWAAFHGNFLLWAASMPLCQFACPQSWVRPKVCALGC